MYIRFLEEITAEEATLVGPKALHLSELAAAGLPVPPGFCVTTAAYQAVVGGETHPAQAARSLPLPEDLEAELRAAYQRLGAERVAVRSSATAEDLPEASFAGMQETCLNVRGEEELIAALRRCWVSLWNERAVHYRQQFATESQVAMAVVVQRMIDAEIAGVLFTVNPVTGAEDEMVVEAVWGLGESLVSGRVTPDRYLLSKVDGQVKEEHIAVKTVQLTVAGEEAVPEAQRTQPCLRPKVLRELADLGQRIENFYEGVPQDVEWAYDGRQVWILQSRPVTGQLAARNQKREAGGTRRSILLAAERERLAAEAGRELMVWSNFSVAEAIPTPRPMTWAVVRRLHSQGGGYGRSQANLGFRFAPEVAEGQVLELIAGHPYFNLNRLARTYFPDLPLEYDLEAMRNDPRLARDPRPILNRAKLRWWQWPWAVWRLMATDRRMRAVRRTYARELEEHIFPAFEAYVRQERQVDLTALTASELLEKLEEWFVRTLDEFGQHLFQPAALAGFSLTNLETALRQALGEREGQDLVRGLAGQGVLNKTTEIHLRLWQVAQEEVSWEEFLAEFGHRATHELELAAPRWWEQPEQVERYVEQFRRHPESNPEARLAAEQRRRRELENRLLHGDLAVRLGFRRPYVEQELRSFQQYLPLRETPKHYFLLGYDLIRRLLVELGRRTGLGERIFDLTPEELPSLLNGRDWQEVIAEREAQYSTALTLELPDLIFSDALDELDQPRSGSEVARLTGLPVSNGIVTGVARIIRDPAEGSRLRPGEILVASATEPGWTPLFATAGGLVLERGGMLSHGAIVAREYALPAVTGVANATHRIPDGATIRVNGREGVVEIVAP
ncbi:MAG TPA: hypothetical protein EYP85_01545 [Armatimonadetes bacterium]|nr:hypothetical protein [Armatimonadota bacterium]